MKNPECNFKNCVNYADGYCHDLERRKDCVAMAVGILCMDGYKSCGFCADLRFANTMNIERCERFNKRNKSNAIARVGVRYSTYFTENHIKEEEKASKRMYKITFCPVCGRLIRL